MNNPLSSNTSTSIPNKQFSSLQILLVIENFYQKYWIFIYSATQPASQLAFTEYLLL